MSSATRNSVSETPIADTRRRLLEVAGEEFAALGYRNATIREICRKANANIAAINYHFGDKAQLYSEVLRHYSVESLQKYPPNLGVSDSASPEEKLHAFVRSFFLRITDHGRPSWYGKLIAREMVDPTHALEERARESMRPTFELLLGILRQLAPKLSEYHQRVSAMSIVGQIAFHHNCRPAIEKIYPEQSYEPEDVERLARHVTDFSLAGLRHLNGAQS